MRENYLFITPSTTHNQPNSPMDRVPVVAVLYRRYSSILKVAVTGNIVYVLLFVSFIVTYIHVAASMPLCYTHSTSL